MTAILADYADVFINAGGDVYGRGYDADGPWVCYLEHPKNPDQAIGEIVLDKKYFASSSPLRRRWRNRHHLVDARAREPASLMTAVYVEGATGLAADGYSTALFVSGYDRAKLLAEERGLAAVLVSPEGDIYRSSGFSGRLYGLD